MENLRGPLTTLFVAVKPTEINLTKLSMVFMDQRAAASFGLLLFRFDCPSVGEAAIAAQYVIVLFACALA